MIWIVTEAVRMQFGYKQIMSHAVKALERSIIRDIKTKFSFPKNATRLPECYILLYQINIVARTNTFTVEARVVWPIEIDYANINRK